MTIPAVAVSLFAGILAIALTSGGEIGLSTQFLLGKFAYSTSNAASLTLLGYLVLAQWAGRIQSNNSGNSARLMIMGGALVFGHTLNLWLTIHYQNEFQFPLGVHLYHWKGAENSFSGLLHSHLGKTAIAASTDAIGWTSPAYDTGRVFLAWVPSAAPWLLMAAFVVATLGALAAIPVIWRRHDGHPAAMALFVLSSLACLKSMLDGGPLAHAVPPATVALIAVSLPPAFRERHRRILAALAIALLASYLALWIDLSPERPIPALGSFLFPLAAYAWLWLVFRKGSMLWRVPLVAFMTISLTLDAADNLAPYLYRQSKECSAVKIYPDKEQVDVISCAGESAFRIYQRLGDDPRKPQSVLISEGGRPGSHDFGGTLQLIDAASNRLGAPAGSVWQAIRLHGDPASSRVLFQATARPDLPPVFVADQGNAISRNNYYVYLHQLSNALRRAGMTEFVVVPSTASNPVP